MSLWLFDVGACVDGRGGGRYGDERRMALRMSQCEIERWVRGGLFICCPSLMVRVCLFVLFDLIPTERNWWMYI